MRAGFIITAPYQLFHYGKIQKYLADTTAYIEVRKQEFGVTKELVEKHLPGADIAWVNSHDLGSIDGQCDVFVCQTPVPVMKFFEKSLIVAQQYSLAKEQYQYGVWRAQANLNLMYGRYSQERVAGFSHAVASGNPLLDDHFLNGEIPKVAAAGAEKIRVLYMPTYGDLSDKESTLSDLLEQDVSLSVKAHHADVEIIAMAKNRSIPVFLSDCNPVDLITQSDVVVSDYSGAIYDALAVRKPVVLTNAINAHSKALSRLSGNDLSRTVVDGLAATWGQGESLQEACERSRRKLENEKAYRDFLDRFYVNLGCAGKACAESIGALVQRGEPDNFAVRQVREANRRYILENRKLRASLKHKTSSAGSRPAAAGVTPALMRLRSESPRVIVLEIIRALLYRMPGGLWTLNLLRKLRGGQSVEGAQRPVDADSDAEQVMDAWTLSPVPRIRRREVLAILVDALRKHGVEHRTHVTETKAYCAVKHSDLDEVCHVLNNLDAEGSSTRFRIWYGSGSLYNHARSAASLTMADVIESESLVVGIPYHNDNYRIERGGGAEILIVEPRDIRLVARRWRAHKVDWTNEFKGPSASNHSIGTLDPAAPARPHALINEPVDVVYTWVDSMDDDWKKQRDEWAAKEGTMLDSAGNDERYLDREELRYSLRSIWLYAPFVRNIYIVTAGHRPAWLDESPDNIHVVSHSDIFPDPSQLPTFNSHAIEACLHRIPGLAEHFIYFNDDVFLGREVGVGAFYTKSGLIKSRLSPSAFTSLAKPGTEAIPTDWASYNAVRLIERDFGLHFDRKMKHVPMPMKRSLLEDLEQRYLKDFSRTRASRFRSRYDLSIPSMLAHYYGIVTGKAVEWRNVAGEYAYADTGRADFTSKLKGIKHRQPTFICLNVTRHSDIKLDQQADILKEYLSLRYPIPSPYEKA